MYQVHIFIPMPTGCFVFCISNYSENILTISPVHIFISVPAVCLGFRKGLETSLELLTSLLSAGCLQ